MGSSRLSCQCSCLARLKLISVQKPCSRGAPPNPPPSPTAFLVQAWNHISVTTSDLGWLLSTHHGRADVLLRPSSGCALRCFVTTPLSSSGLLNPPWIPAIPEQRAAHALQIFLEMLFQCLKMGLSFCTLLIPNRALDLVWKSDA